MPTSCTHARLALFRHFEQGAVNGIWRGRIGDAAGHIGYASATTAMATCELLDIGAIEYQERGCFGAPSVLRVIGPAPGIEERATMWPPEKDATLTKMWGSGHTATEIGEALGITKNAVLGRRKRLNLPMRANPVTTPRSYPKCRKMKVPAASKPVAKPKAAPKPAPPRARPVTRGVGRTSVSLIARPIVVPFRAPAPPTAPRPRFIAEVFGPSLQPCQWVVRDGSVIEPWVHCGVTRATWPYCAGHMKRAYGRQEEAA